MANIGNLTDFSMGRATLLEARLTTQNPRHTLACIGREIGIRNEAFWTEERTRKYMTESPRGLATGLVQIGQEWASPILATIGKDSDLYPMRRQFEAIMEADRLFTGFASASHHDILGVRLSAYPGLDSLEKMGMLFPHLKDRVDDVRDKLRANYYDGTPITISEDHPSYKTEKISMVDIRGNFAASVSDAWQEAQEVAALVDGRYGQGTMAGIKYICVMGIGANDMYLKDLPMLINSDPDSRRKLYSIFAPKQLYGEARVLPNDATPENTLYIAISRGGGTRETIESIRTGFEIGEIKHLVCYANKGEVKQISEDAGAVCLSLPGDIGGRFMWAKGKIVLVPLALTASDKAWGQYTGAMIDLDNKYWPVGDDMTLFNTAAHMFYYTSAYNIPEIMAISNSPVLDAGLRQTFQIINESTGGVSNSTLAVGAGMEIEPFSHAGLEGVLARAVAATTYGMFQFNTQRLYPVNDLAEVDYRTRGEILSQACVYPVQGKITYAGAPNLRYLQEGLSYANAATNTFIAQNVCGPFVMDQGFSFNSNPQVALVRETTGMIYDLLMGNLGADPMELIEGAIVKMMTGGRR